MRKYETKLRKKHMTNRLKLVKLAGGQWLLQHNDQEENAANKWGLMDVSWIGNKSNFLESVLRF